MGKNNIAIRQWLSNEERFSFFVNGALFRGAPVFNARNLKKDDGQQGLILKTPDGKEISVERYRDITMTARTNSDETKIMILACEHQDEIHYAMPVRTMLYDALNYVDQINEIRRKNRKDKTLTGSAEFLSGLKKTDKLCPVITIIFYYGEERWMDIRDLHSLLGIDQDEYKMLRKFIPNYTINLIDPREIDDLNCFGKDLQTVFEMLQYRKDKTKLLDYVNDHKDYFKDVDETTGRAIEVFLGSRSLIDNIKKNESGGFNMCQALDEYYQDGVNEGIEHGIERGITLGIECGAIRLIRRKLKQAVSIDEISEWMDLDTSSVLQIEALITKYPDESDGQIANRIIALRQ